MLVEIDHINPGPRADGGPKPFKPENGVVKPEFFDDTETFLITITDKANPEFRVKLGFSLYELYSLIKNEE